jgi:hypothetical protein
VPRETAAFTVAERDRIATALPYRCGCFGARSVKTAHSAGAPARIGTDDEPMPQFT